jgi:hypothetical protein
MILLVPSRIVAQLVEALKVGGNREVGGILMGEHVEAQTFRVQQITVQLEGGTFARFVRWVENIITPLRDFFQSTNHDYVRFNYIGEWHSHHSFALVPSPTDDGTMFDILSQPRFDARFVVLLLTKLAQSKQLSCAVMVYQPGERPFPGQVVPE